MFFACVSASLQLLGDVTIASGGVLPNIHTHLLPKSKGKGGKGAAAGDEGGDE